MDRAGKIQSIDNRVTWSLVFYKNTKIPFQTCEELSVFLKKEKNYWKLYEGDFPDGAVRFSNWYEKCDAAIDDIIAQLSEERLTTSEFSRFIKKQFSNHGIMDVTENQTTSDSFSINIRNFELISPNTPEPEAAAYAYKNLYTNEKPVYDAFIQIVEKQAWLNNYLSSNSNKDQHNAAMRYIGFKLHMNEYPSPNLIDQEKIEDLRNEINVISQNLIEKRVDINEFRAKINDLYEENMTKFNDLYEENMIKANALEETYKEKLHLSAPVDYWEKEAKKKQKSFYIWLGITTAMCVVLLLVATELVSIILSQAEVIIGLAEVSPLYYVPQYFIFVAIITFLVYIVRIFVKITMSEKHMQAEYSQKAALTYFYLSLLQNSDSGITKEDRPVVLSALFSKIDTGLIKSDGKSETDAGLLATLLNNK